MMRIILFSFFVLISLWSLAQNCDSRKVQLQIVDSRNRKPIIESKTTIVGLSFPALEIQSDSTGNLFFYIPCNKEIVFQTSAKGFLNNMSKVTTTKGNCQDTLISIILESQKRGEYLPIVLFLKNKSEATTNGVNGVFNIMNEFPQYNFRIIGRSDIEEAKEDSLIGLKRAEAVYNKLIEKGIDKNRLSIMNQTGVPTEVSQKNAYFDVGKILDEKYTNILSPLLRDKAYEFNRVVVFQILNP